SLRASHRREEVGARALLELAAGLGAETHGIGGGALPLGFEDAAAVGLGDQAAKAQSPGGDDGVARDRRAAGALEHRKEGALGRERGRGVGVVDGGEQRERGIVGMSLAECTARSMAPAMSASSISFVNKPLPPASANGRSRITSPLVRMTSSSMRSAASACAAARRARTSLACASASGLPRVPMTSGADRLEDGCEDCTR